MQEKWHSWIDYRWGGWLCAAWLACSWFRSRREEPDPEVVLVDRWLLLLLLLASLVPTLWYTLREDLLGGRNTVARRSARLTWTAHLHHLFSYSFALCLLLATYGRVWNFAEIGFRMTSPWSWTILFGLLCHRFQSLIRGAVDSWLASADETSLESFRRVCIVHFLPRGRFAQCLNVLTSGVLGPLHEEIVYRGFLVYMLGNLAGHPAWGIALGLILCLVVHLYQGPRSMPSHALFFAAAVAILYSPAGLLSVLVMHVTNNLHHCFHLPIQLDAYLKHRLLAREQKQAQRSAAAATA